MKKVFLFLATAALLASCSSDLFESDSYQASNHKGITFEVVENAATRGLTEEVGGAFKSYFFAEQDRINIWSDNALIGSAPGTSTAWTLAPAVYKATSSTGNPRFTSIDDANVLNFKAWNNSPSPVGKFFVAYPTGQTVANVDGKFNVTPNINLQEQTMDGYMNFNSRLMYDYAEAKKADGSVKERNISVGERVEMQLKSPLSLAAFYIKDINGYKSQFGELKQVMFTALGDEPLIPAMEHQDIIVEQEDLTKVGDDWYLKDQCTPHYRTLKQTGAVVEIPVESTNYYFTSTCENVGGVYVLGQHSEKCNDPDAEDTNSEPISWATNPGAVPHYVGEVISHVAYNDYFSFNPADETVSYVNKSEGAPMVKRAKLNITHVDIKNNDMMNLYVLPTSGHDESNMAKYTITYKFEKVDLSYVKETKANFKADGGLKFGLEIAEQFPYIVTKGTDGNNRDLIVNSGNLAQVFKVDGDMVKVKWTDEFATTGEVDPTTIKTITIKSGVAPITEWALLNKFTNATELNILNGTPKLVNVKGLDALQTLKAPFVTEVGQNAFDSGIAGSLRTLILPSAATIATQSDNFTQLTYLDLGAYTFTDNEAVTPDVFFNANTKTTLRTVDLRSVTSLAPVFGYERNILFTDYTELKDIYLNNGTKISANEFKGCTSLNYVGGVVDFGTATSAFEGCTSLQAVNVKGTVIPASAFKGSKVKVIKVGGDQIVPTYVGASAFEGNEAVTSIDLKNAATIEANAFKNASNFVGKGKNGVVTLIVNEVAASAFEGTAVVRFQLLNARTTKSKSLASTALKQIKYRKTGLTIASDQVQTKENVDIFLKDATEQGKFAGYRTVTEEDFDWEY